MTTFYKNCLLYENKSIWFPEINGTRIRNTNTKKNKKTKKERKKHNDRRMKTKLSGQETAQARHLAEMWQKLNSPLSPIWVVSIKFDTEKALYDIPASVF